MLFLLYSKMNRPNIYIYPLSFGLPSHSYHHSALSKVPCAIQYVLISYLFYVYSLVPFGEGNGTPLQYSCLENPMDGGAW